VYNQSYALEFDGKIDTYLACGNDRSLDLSEDLTIEVFVQTEATQRQGILTKGGRLGDIESGQNVPYMLSIDADGQVIFSFEDQNGEDHFFKSNDAIKTKSFHKIAVTRKYNPTETIMPLGLVITDYGYDISFYINGKKSFYRYELLKQTVHKDNGHTSEQKIHSNIGDNDQDLEIGRIYSNGLPVDPFNGKISEVRIWDLALDDNEIGRSINRNEKGLVSWWRLEENQGRIAFDSKSENNAKINGAKWVKNPDPEGSSLNLYVNGELLPAISIANPNPTDTDKKFTVGNPFCNLDEIRIWKVARTQEQIQDNLFSRLKKAEKKDLIAYYPCDQDKNELSDHSFQGNNLPFPEVEMPCFLVSTAPISNEMPIVASALGGNKNELHQAINSSPSVQEYGDMQYDINGNLIGSIQKRCYMFIQDDKWCLVTGYKVGNLKLEWIGQVQTNPQIIGYIEGAPPVPSENLTGKLGEVEDYSGISSVEFSCPENINYIYSSSRETGFDMSQEFSAGVGPNVEGEAGFIYSHKVAKVEVTPGLKASFELSKSQLNETSISSARNRTQNLKLELRGVWEDNDPSGYINAAVGRRFIPSNLGLALVESDTMDMYALRLEHNNALVGYRMIPNPNIPKDVNLIPFPLNPWYTKQGTLDGKVGVKEDGSVQCDPDYPNASVYGEYSFYKPKEAYTLKKRIERQRTELETYYESYRTPKSPYSPTVPETKELFARNIANTYIWTADGGFFAESTEVMEAMHYSSSGIYSFQGMAGPSVDLVLKLGSVAIKFQLDALFGGHVEHIRTKEKDTEKSFSLEVEADPESDLQLYINTDAEKAKYSRINEGGGAYDQQGNPVMRPGKVDAYRFMTFFLESEKRNFEDFVNKVVDPIWLSQSTTPNARALRQATAVDGGCWRIMHRVTFVSRIFEEFEKSSALEKAVKKLDINSNYELIKTLEPFVQSKRGDFVQFSAAVRAAIQAYLPELIPHEELILQFMCDYYQVYDD